MVIYWQPNFKKGIFSKVKEAYLVTGVKKHNAVCLAPLILTSINKNYETNY